MRDRERLGLLRIHDRALVLHSMKWPDEIRDPAELAPEKTAVETEELDRALQVMENMASTT